MRNELWQKERMKDLNISLKKVVEGEESPYQIAENLFNDFKQHLKV